MIKTKKMLPKTANLIRGIYEYNVLSHFKTLEPTSLQINITYKCNSHCQMCNIWRVSHKEELSLSDWQKLLSDPIFKSIKYLAIAGGEPSLHPKFVELIKKFVQSMPALESLSIVTNGFLTPKIASDVKELAEFLKKKNISFSVTVSLDGIGKLHDEMRNTPNAFKMASATLTELKKINGRYNFNLGAAALISGKNLYQVEEVERWCKGENIPFNYQLIGFHESYVQNMDRIKDMDFKPDDRPYLLKLMEKLAKNKSIKDLNSYYWQDMINLYTGGKRKTPCPFTKDAFVVDALGDVYYCLSLGKIGNWPINGSISSIYFNKENIERRKIISKEICPDCNSLCMVRETLKKDFKKYAWFLLNQNLSVF